MKLILCFLLLLTELSATSETPKSWTEWVSEGSALHSAGNNSAAALAFRKALTTAEGSQISDRQLVGIYDDLASVYADVGQFLESEHAYRRGLAIVEKSEGRHSLDYALLLAGISMLPTYTGNLNETITVLREAIARHSQSASARDLAVVREFLAAILVDRKMYDEAETLLLDSQSDLARLRTSRPTLQADLLNSLGVLRFHQGLYDKSVDLHIKSLQLLESTVSSSHPSLILPLNDLAAGYAKTDRLNDARSTYERAISVCNRSLGSDHPNCGILLHNYAVVLRKLGHKREAKEMEARSRQIARASLRRAGVGATIDVAAFRGTTKPRK
jgi:tetratricopeptide (TPR) repeat protein